MKKAIITTILSIIFFSNILAQNVSVDKSLWSIQTGLIGFWINNESKVSNSTVLRAEVGIEATSLYFSNQQTYYTLNPTIKIEPRWYYNLSKRFKNEKNTTRNAANFVSFQIRIYPQDLVITNNKSVSSVNEQSFIPTWGLRRNLNKQFNYEFGIGAGLSYDIFKLNNSRPSELSPAINLHLRLSIANF
jgi:hypothetical protein